MCGIAGLMSKSDRLLSSPEQNLQAVADGIFSRGPDSLRIERSETYWFAHSLLDITNSMAKQPVLQSNGDILLFNGEVYRGMAPHCYDQALEADTDFLARTITYENVFTVCGHLEGMFALALFSPRLRRLKLVRCLSGQKPLFFGTDDDRVGFSSSIDTCRQLVNAGDIEEHSVAFSLRMGYPPPRRTIYKNIFSVPPGTGVEVCLESCKVLRESPLSHEIGSSLAGFDPLKIVDDLADAVPGPNWCGKLGLNLSGGLDSRLVLGAIKIKRGLDDVNVVTNQFSVREPKYNFDSQEAIRFCKRQGIDLTVLNVSAGEYMSNFCAAYLSVGQINYNLSVPTYYAQALLHKALGSKVVLTGDGADEILGGYEFYFQSVRMRRLAKYWLHQPQVGLHDLTADIFGKSLKRELWQYYDFRKLYHHKHYLTGNEVKYEDFCGYVESDIARLAKMIHLRGASRTERVKKLMLIDRCLWLSSESVPRTDNLYGNLGIEARSPFLLNRFLGDYLGGANISKTQMDKWQQKQLLKQRFQESQIFRTDSSMQKKFGWTAPYKDWWLLGLKDLALAIIDQGGRDSVPFVDWASLRKDVSESRELPGKYLGAYLSYALIATGKSV